MSAHKYPSEARSIVNLLRVQTEHCNGVFTMHEVEVLEGVLRTQSDLIDALELLLAEASHGSTSGWAKEQCRIAIAKARGGK